MDKHINHLISFAVKLKSGKPAMSKVCVLERDLEKSQTLVQVLPDLMDILFVSYFCDIISFTI